MKTLALLTLLLLINSIVGLEPLQILNCGTRLTGLYQSFYPYLIKVNSLTEFDQLISSDRTSRDVSNAVIIYNLFYNNRWMHAVFLFQMLNLINYF